MSKNTSSSPTKKQANKAANVKSPKGHNYWKIALLVLFGLFLVCMVIRVVTQRQKYTKEDQHCVRLQVESECVVSLEYARSAEQQIKGFSDRASTPANHGLMFVFLKSGEQCFWMKDMKFPLDIIWINSNKQIVHMEQNLSPDTFPTNYCPKVDAQYVLEINAGEAQKLGLQNNQQLHF